MNDAESLEEDFSRLAILQVFPALNAFKYRIRDITLRVFRLAATLQNIQAGDYPAGDYRFAQFDLMPLVNAAVLSFQSEARSRALLVDIQGRRRLTVWASEAHTRLVLNNLIHNAFKYSHAAPARTTQSGTVQIRASHPGNFACLKISNVGTGILANERSLIFDPGYRGTLARAEGRTGMGMGLYTAHRILSAMGGDLKIRSEPINGNENGPYLTEVIVKLPRQNPS